MRFCLLGDGKGASFLTRVGLCKTHPLGEFKLKGPIVLATDIFYGS